MSEKFRNRLRRLHDAHQRGREETGGPGGVYDAGDVRERSAERGKEKKGEEEAGEGWARFGAKRERAGEKEFWSLQERCRSEEEHGIWKLGECRQRQGSSLKPLLKKESLAGELGGDDLLYMDTETTGLGEGALAFMIGLGFWDGEDFLVEQLLIESPEEEEAMLLGFAERLSEFKCLVTFNGKSFDVPLLARRYQTLGLKTPFAGKEHLDLLLRARKSIPGRKRYRLSSLEEDLLRFHRVGDVPGREIPPLWRRFLRGDSKPMGGVLEHNRHDIVSMAALLAHLVEPKTEKKRREGRSSGVRSQLERTYRLRESFTSREKPERRGEEPVENQPGPESSPVARKGDVLSERVRILRGAGRQLVDQGLWEQAFGVITELLAISPEDSWGLQQLARYYAQSGQEELARAIRERLRG